MDYTPEWFLEAFRATGIKHKQPWSISGGLGSRDGSWTEWFEECMQTIAARNELYCQNRASDTSGSRKGEEWMRIDHIFVARGAGGIPGYDQFPLIVVEHENGELGGMDGELPPGDADQASVEWSFWKTLSVRAKLSVLVAYPNKNQKPDAFSELNTMLSAWRRTYDEIPNVLVLLGWWRPEEGIEDIYTAYHAVEEGDGVALVAMD